MRTEPDAGDPKRPPPGKPAGKLPAKVPAKVPDKPPAKVPQPDVPGPQRRKSTRSERPGGQVQTDHSGKTYEGKTGVSGETAEDSGL